MDSTNPRWSSTAVFTAEQYLPVSGPAQFKPVLSRVICKYIYKEFYYTELVHAVREADKSQDLQLASWRPRRAGGVVPTHV